VLLEVVELGLGLLRLDLRLRVDALVAAVFAFCDPICADVSAFFNAWSASLERMLWRCVVLKSPLSNASCVCCAASLSSAPRCIPNEFSPRLPMYAFWMPPRFVANACWLPMPADRIAAAACARSAPAWSIGAPAKAPVWPAAACAACCNDATCAAAASFCVFCAAAT
jgi:hypothetical protein